jgi:hypothetical protein
MVASTKGLRPEKDCAGKDQRQTRPLVREGVPEKQDRNCQTVINIWSWAPDGGSTPRLTDWLTVSRNVTLTWHQQFKAIERLVRSAVQLWLLNDSREDYKSIEDNGLTDRIQYESSGGYKRRLELMCYCYIIICSVIILCSYNWYLSNKLIANPDPRLSR